MRNWQFKSSVLVSLIVALAGLAGCGGSSNNRVIIIATRTPNPSASATPGATVTVTTAVTGTPAVTSTPGPSKTAAPTATATASGSTPAHAALFVADSSNNRVHVFFPPFSNGQAAGLAIGAPDLGSIGPGGATQSTLQEPAAVAFDQAGNFWVADAFNQRVLRFPTPFSTGMKADLVVGQTDFVSMNPALAQNRLNDPLAVAFDAAGDLFVCDTMNNRVLIFKPPFSIGMNASVVIGQTDFVSSVAQTTQSGLNLPVGDAIDASGNLWVADDRNNRVLEYKPPFTNGMNASLVLGQPNFTSANAPGPLQNSLDGTEGVTTDAAGDVFVADTNNNRVLEYEPPFSNGMNAAVVFGQPDFTTGSVATTQNKMATPRVQVFIEGPENLWVADNNNSRILEFKPPFSNGMNASLVIGQSNFTGGTESGGTTGLAEPLGVAVKP